VRGSSALESASMQRVAALIVGLAAAAVIGGLGAMSIAGLELAASEMLGFFRDNTPSIYLLALLPTIGLAISAASLSYLGEGASPATADAYFLAMRKQRDLDPWPAPARVLGLVASIGTGGALGFEGPALYIGASIGTLFRRSLAILQLEPVTALVAGAAGAVGGLFQQPLLGAIAAIDMPYRSGIDVKRLPAALIGGLAGWVMFGVVRLEHSEIIPNIVDIELSTTVFIAAILAALIASVVARVFGIVVMWAKRTSTAVVSVLRVAIAGGVLFVLVLMAHQLVGTSVADNVAIGPGPRTLEVLLRLAEQPSVMLILSLIALRIVATAAVVGGGGVGGLFVPLLTLGGLAGLVASRPFDVDPAATLVVCIVGAGACVAVGYQVPLTGIAYIAGVLGLSTGLALAIPTVILAMLLGQGVRVSSAQGVSPKLQPPTKRRRTSVFEPDDRDATGEWYTA
jgi:chloride channel protein, CIC family